jgi:hypothetical protein
MPAMLDRAFSRRQFLIGAGVAAGALSLANTQCDPAIVRRLHQADANASSRNAVWVWQFSVDGPASVMAEELAARNLAVVVKTHDGLEWMAKYDPVPGAIAGPDSIRTLAAVFEAQGVPFHAWCVVTGGDPAREAAMAADVLDAGARSLTIDLEDDPPFWRGNSAGALRYGHELRDRNPYARIDISIDPRPWRLLHLPLREFVKFTDGIRPQIYWDLFNTQDNINAYTYMGYPPDSDGITPAFLLETTQRMLNHYDRWIVPIAVSSPLRPDTWPRFQRAAWELGMREVNAWRYGITSAAVLGDLGRQAPQDALS